MKRCAQKLVVLALFLCLAACSTFSGQDYGAGAILDAKLYEQIPVKPGLEIKGEGDYKNLPPKVSLKQYSPVPEHQGNYNTCVGWATAYAARTISESIAKGRTSKEQISNSAFSPTYVYKKITKDPSGKKRAPIYYALKEMEEPGIVKRPQAEKERDFKDIPLSPLYDAERYYPISYPNRLFNKEYSEEDYLRQRVLPVKNSLFEEKPVIIAMNCPPSFNNARDRWQPDTPREKPSETYKVHAMCVIGYDDEYDGSGAFEIQNSYGTEWGNNGYIWISYKDFADFVPEAYEFTENLCIYEDAELYGASVQIEVKGSSGSMPINLDPERFYKVRSTLPAGTEFRFRMTNRYPAYVYAFITGRSAERMRRVFPKDLMSPAAPNLPGTIITWPDKGYYKLDNVSDEGYLVVLFSKQAFKDDEINAIEKRLAERYQGSFPDQVANAVGGHFNNSSRVQYDSDTIGFSVQARNPKAVFGLLVKIEHRPQ